MSSTPTSTSTATSTSAGGAGGTSVSTGTGGACVPVDDGNECTDDVCENGVPVHNPTAAGSACTVDGTLCDGLGGCVACLMPADCAGVDDACQTRTCTKGVCGFDFTPAGTALPTQLTGDCLEAQCDGAGATVQAIKDTDLPDDMNACTDDACAGGLPSHTFTALGSACGAGLVCNATGTCVGCNVATDCAGVDDECKTRTCTAGMCGVSFTAAGTPVAAQTPADCLVAACDGAGNIANIADDLDLPADDGNFCTDEVCTAGMATHPAKTNGTVCTDGDACTVADTCQAGTCTSGAPVTCAALDQCHTAGTCNSATGVCTNPNKADGVACNDGNACTQTDTCQAGTCAGANPVTCAALDQCHTAGSCNAATGMCTNPNKADGVACNDGNACTQTDTCQAGTCAGANPVTCAALDQCHTAGTCNAATGMCTNPNKADGSACNDGNACTQTDTCQAGTCAGANPVTCAALDQCHTAGTCSAATGMCTNPNKANGTACNDGNACTQTDTCQAGTCAGANPVTCTAQDQCHNAGTCAPATGMCSNPNKADGTSCSDGSACTQTDTCQAGTCSGANPVTCAPLDQCHVAGTCNAGTGVCTNPNATDGTACTVGAKAGTCQTGSCVPTIVCGNGIIEAGETCDDGNTTAGDGCSPTCGCELTQPVTVDPNPNVSIVDDGYNGTLASMACVSIPVTAVAGCSANVTSVTVTPAISHTWVGDLVIKLVAPDATVVTLMSRPGAAEPADDGGAGGAGDSSNLVSAFPITFVTGAAVSAENMGNTITSAQNVCQNDNICSFAPANGAAAAGTLATFIGKPAAGTWKFCVGDSGLGDVGNIDKVTLTLGQ
jgi:cysteine-rich repeat protein